MASRRKKLHEKIETEFQQNGPLFDEDECVKLYAYGYKKNPNYGSFTTIYPVSEIIAIVREHRSDDEVITIRYKNGEEQFKDGSDCRIMDFDVYSELFITKEEINKFIENHLYSKVLKEASSE